ncbi:unnamed protein product, partial [Prorocentrum cordatum]
VISPKVISPDEIRSRLIEAEGRACTETLRLAARARRRPPDAPWPGAGPRTPDDILDKKVMRCPEDLLANHSAIRRFDSVKGWL